VNKKSLKETVWVVGSNPACPTTFLSSQFFRISIKAHTRASLPRAANGYFLGNRALAEIVQGVSGYSQDR
jgi:hypothetical protein